jgi:gliding motility-associated-like protein
MKTMKILLLFTSLTMVFQFSYAQTPNVQDCGGAIPICQNVYHEANSYTGMGNIQNEIDSTTSCTDGEDNAVWYTFTAQTTGNFSFVITPNNTSGSGDDYDWTVFDLTHSQCSDIYNNPSIEVSCNSYGSFTSNSTTGASTANGGVGNSNGPGEDNGPPWNADIPVIAGNKYVMMVSNWTGSTYGYTIDFSTSSAQLYDNVPPHIQSITSLISCGTNSITFNFSENILCSTVSSADFTLTGPGGPYTISSISGPVCSQGGNQEQIFTINFSPSISSGGTYNLNLVSSSGSVTDLCANVAPAGSLPFSVNLFNTSTSTTPATCGASDGSATVVASGSSGTFSYLWSTTPPQTSAHATGLAAGNYFVTVYNGTCSVIDTANVGTNSDLSASITNIINETCGMSDGSATVSVSGGTAPYAFIWNTIPSQTLATATNLSAGNYTVTLTDVNGCSIVLNTSITVGAGPSGTVITENSHCGNNDGSAIVTATGGFGDYTYLWNTGETSNSITNQYPGTYTVLIDDGYCDTTITVIIPNTPGPRANFIYNPDPISINDPEVTFSSITIGASSWVWDFGDTTGEFSGQNVVHTFQHTGNYQVMLIIQDSHGCIDTLIKTVTVNDIFTIYIPNCFTPDGDGLNDSFGPEGVSFAPESYSMVIFNRWGNIMYETNSLSEPWNGGFQNSTSHESKMPGVYTYRIILAGLSYPEMLYVGKIILLK